MLIYDGEALHHLCSSGLQHSPEKTKEEKQFRVTIGSEMCKEVVQALFTSIVFFEELE